MTNYRILNDCSEQKKRAIKQNFGFQTPSKLTVANLKLTTKTANLQDACQLILRQFQREPPSSPQNNQKRCPFCLPKKITLKQLV